MLPLGKKAILTFPLQAHGSNKDEGITLIKPIKIWSHNTLVVN